MKIRIVCAIICPNGDVIITKNGKIVAGGGCDILCSGDEPIFKHIITVSEKKSPRLLYLPTASFDSEDSAPLYARRFMELGCGLFDILFLTDPALCARRIKEKILGADIVFAGGGNLKFLMDTWTSTGADKYLQEAYENGAVLSGSSSGAMCWFDWGYDDCGENGSFMFVKCLGLLPRCCCPHFDSPYWKSFEEAIKQCDFEGVAIDNNTALSYCGSGYKIIKTAENKSAYFFDRRSI